MPEGFIILITLQPLIRNKKEIIFIELLVWSRNTDAMYSGGSRIYPYTTTLEQVLPPFLWRGKLLQEESRLLTWGKHSLKNWNSKRRDSNLCPTPKPTFFSLQKKKKKNNYRKETILFGLRKALLSRTFRFGIIKLKIPQRCNAWKMPKLGIRRVRHCCWGIHCCLPDEETPQNQVL